MRHWRPAAILSLLVSLIIVAPRSEAQTIGRSLGQPLPDLKFDGIPLEDAIEFLRDVSNANLHVNWRAMEEVGVERGTLINVRLRRVPLAKVLTLILTEAGGGSDLLTWYVDDGVIHVTTREMADRDMITKVYPVDDLLMEIPDFIAPSFDLDQTEQQTSGRGGGGSSGGGSLFTDTDRDEQRPTTRTERAQQLIDMITSVVQPDIWAVNGGRAAIRFWNGSLIVTAPRSVHDAIGY